MKLVITRKGAYHIEVNGEMYVVAYDPATEVERAFVNAAYDYQGSIDALIGKINSTNNGDTAACRQCVTVSAPNVPLCAP